MPWLLPNPEHYGCELGTVAFPMFNPAAGFRSPETQAQVSYGFGQLALFLQGAIEPRRLFHDEYPEPVYREITDVAHLLCVLGSSTTIYIDSEGHPDRVWSVQFALKPGVAYLLRMKQTEIMRAFFQWLIGTKPRIVYHGSLHDFGIMRAVMQSLEIPIDALYGIEFDDTQIMAYLLQLEPIGLKPNCVRHAGMVMQSYDEVLGDAQDSLARDYLVGVFDAEQADYEVRQQEAFEEINRTPLLDKLGNPRTTKDGRPKYHRTTVLPGLPRTDLHKAAERVLRSRSPFKLWHDQREDIAVAAYTCLGDMPQATLDHVSYETARHYACRDADGTARLAPQLHSRLKALDLESVYRLELSTYPLIDRMMMVGVKPNLPHFADLGWKLQGHIEELQARLEEATNRPTFNANSGDQVADYLFDSLGLPGYKKTPEGRQSTNDKILEALEREFGVQYPEISLIREYRETYKLKHTFVDRVPDFTRRWPRDGRVHATFRTTRVVTGRLAASDPNLLAQPEHGQFAPDFKRGWEAEPGHVVAAWDESQIELRVLAHLSQDPVLLRAYREGIDLHASLAERIFGVKPGVQDKSKHRLPAKAINFGIPMGMQAQGLTIELRKNGVMVDEDDAQRWLDETNKLYAGVQIYKDRMISEARRNGYIRCLSGRIRYIGGIASWDRMLRAEAERYAFSTPIQEGAQWIMKQAEALIWTDIIRPYHAAGHWIEPLMQVHDAIKLEMEEGLQGEVNVLMRWAMVDAVEDNLSVPLGVEGSWGYNFADMEDFA